MNTSDFDLLARWRDRRDATAFTEIVHRHGGMVYGTCRRVLGNESEAEDIAQDCFLYLAETRAPISESLGGWLHALARRRSINRLRSEGRRARRERALEAREEPPTEAHQHELERHVDACIDSLPEDLRFIVVEYFLKGISQPSIARGLSVSQSTISRRIEEGVAAIRDSLAGRGVVVASTVLAAFFAAENAVAAPAALVAALGKMALGGGAHLSLSGAIGGILAMKKLAAGIAAAVALSLLFALWAPDGPEERAKSGSDLRTEGSPIAPIDSPIQRGETVANESSAQDTTNIATEPLATSPSDDVLISVLSRGVLEVGQGDSSITGSVLWKRTEEPCRGCEVGLSSADPEVEVKLETSSEGNFSFRGLEPGTYWLRAESSDSLPWTRVTVTLAAGEDREGLRLLISAGGTVEGQAYLGGEPLVDAVFEIRHLNEGGRMAASSVETDADGFFRWTVYSKASGRFAAY